MKSHTRIARCARTLRFAGAVVGVCFATAAVASAPPPPTAPTTSYGDYTVTPHGCNKTSGTMFCAGIGLEELIEPGGSWRSVGQTFVGKPPGAYSYRSVDVYCDAWYGWCYSRYSSAVTVTVIDASALPPEPLDRQLSYRYTVRTGNLVGDSRIDLLVRRVSGPASGNGVIDTIVLEQISSGRFRARVPSTTLASSSLWRASGLSVSVEDMNADGYVDLLVNDVATAIPGAHDPIVYASGMAGVATPKGVKAADAALRQFSDNMLKYVVDNDYFLRTAGLAVNTWIYRPVFCPTQPGIGEWSMIYMLQCNDFVVVYYEVVPDYSGFSRDAVEIWQDELAVASGELASSNAAQRILERIESAIGVEIGGWDMSEIFGSGPGIDDPAERKGLDGFLAILGIGNARADEAADADGVPGPRQPDKIYIVGRYIFGSTVNKMHTALLYHMPVTGAPTWYSAFDTDDRSWFDGQLVARTNSPKDSPLLMRATLGEAVPLSGESQFNYFFVNMLSAHDHYRNLPLDRVAKYDAVPEIPCGGCDGRNSNGYVHGLINATGGQPNAAPGFTLNGLTGWEYPVEAYYFGR